MVHDGPRQHSLGESQLSFDRRSFLASAVLGLDIFRRKITLFDFNQQAYMPKEKAMSDISNIPLTSHHLVEADGVHVFYREAGPADAPVILLLHGFPTSSFQYRELIPRLADR